MSKRDRLHAEMRQIESEGGTPVRHIWSRSWKAMKEEFKNPSAAPTVSDSVSCLSTGLSPNSLAKV